MSPSRKISVITPAFGQLDWLRLCIASVADQVVPEAGVIVDLEAESKGRAQRLGIHNKQSPIPNQQSSPLCVEHIIQDGGTPGIEEFAREMGAEFYRDGKLVFGPRPSTFDAPTHRLVIYTEPDAGMYDALNKGIARMSGDLWAWLNCDEQYLPGTLAFVSEWFNAHPQTDILCGDALLTDGEGKAVSYRRIVSPGLLHTRLVHLASASCSSFYRRSIVERGGLFDIQWRSIGDAEWMERMLRAGVRVSACGQLFASFAFTGVNTSESPLAAKETAHWQAMPDAPPSWMKRPVTLLYRLRKMLAGAYRKRTVTYALHQKGSEGRVTRTARDLGWSWGGSLKS